MSGSIRSRSSSPTGTRSASPVGSRPALTAASSMVDLGEGGILWALSQTVGTDTSSTGHIITPAPTLPALSPGSSAGGSRPVTPEQSRASILQKLRLSIVKYYSTGRLVQLAGAASAAGLAASNTPVAWWAGTPAIGGLVSSGQFFSKRTEAGKREIQEDFNESIVEFLMTKNRVCQRSLTDATYDYMRAQSVRGALESVAAVGSLVGGHFNGDTGKLLNSLLHMLPAASAYYSTGWSLLKLIAHVLQQRNLDQATKWLAALLAIKGYRAAARTAESALPWMSNQQILSVLAGLGFVGLMADIGFAHGIELMAKNLHFIAYKERMTALGVNDFHATASGIELQMLPAPVTATAIARDTSQDIFTEIVFMLFRDDMPRWTRNNAIEIIGDPAGWQAIAHRIAHL